MSVMKENEYRRKYGNFFKPAKYLVPAACAALMFAGCTDTGNDDGDGGGGGGGGDTVTRTGVAFKTPVTVEGLPGYTGLSLFSSYVFAPALADMDGDGDLDLIIGEKFSQYVSSYGSSYDMNKIVYYKNTIDAGGSLEFAESTDLSNLPDYDFHFLSMNFSSAVGPLFPALIDTDGDGDYDLFHSWNYNYYSAGLYFDKSIIYSQKNELNVFSAETSVSYGYYSVSSIALVDADGDDDIDLVIGRSISYSSANIINEVIYKENQASQPYQFGDTFEHDILTQITVSDTTHFPIPSFADLDNDGDQDMFVINYADGSLKYYENDGAVPPAWTLKAETFSMLPDDGVKYFPAFGDLDGDDDIDVIVGTDDGRLLFIENTDIP